MLAIEDRCLSPTFTIDMEELRGICYIAFFLTGPLENDHEICLKPSIYSCAFIANLKIVLHSSDGNFGKRLKFVRALHFESCCFGPNRVTLVGSRVINRHFKFHSKCWCYLRCSSSVVVCVLLDIYLISCDYSHQYENTLFF